MKVPQGDYVGYGEVENMNHYQGRVGVIEESQGLEALSLIPLGIHQGVRRLQRS